MHVVLKVLLLSYALCSLALGMLGPVYAIFVEEIGRDILDAGSAWSIYMFTMGVL